MRPRLCNRGRGAAPGFTIIEILIAIGILAVVVGAIYSSWIAILRGRQVGLDSAAAAQRSRISIEVLAEALASAQMYQANARYYGFEGWNGDKATLSFVSRLPSSFPRSGRYGAFDLRRVIFSLEPGPNHGNQLVLRQSPILVEMDEDEMNNPVVLARGVKEFKLEFLDPRYANNAAATTVGTTPWLEEWTQTNTLPRLVRITLSVEQETAKGIRTTEERFRQVSLPAAGVQTAWQMPSAQGGTGAGAGGTGGGRGADGRSRTDGGNGQRRDQPGSDGRYGPPGQGGVPFPQPPRNNQPR